MVFIALLIAFYIATNGTMSIKNFMEIVISGGVIAGIVYNFIIHFYY